MNTPNWDSCYTLAILCNFCSLVVVQILQALIGIHVIHLPSLVLTIPTMAMHISQPKGVQ
jgi:hypothetical protein